jgi:methionyl-tRNA synthetase
VVDAFNAAAAAFERDFAAFRFAAALRHLWEALAATNKLIQDTEPWRLCKERDEDPAAGELYDEVMRTAGSILQSLAALLSPVMPAQMQALWESLGGAGKLADYRYAGDSRFLPVASEATIEKGEALFPRIDAKSVPSFTERAEQAG